MSATWSHTPVLLGEVIEQLRLRPGARCLDATIDGGGHAAAILAAIAPGGRLLGIDRDPAVLDALHARFAAPLAAGELVLANGDFRDLNALLAAQATTPLDGAVFDLGLSSFHLDASGRGFSFSRDEPLDMRFDPHDTVSESAADILATREAAALTRLLRDYGEERFASRIARTIVARRAAAPVRTSGQLLDCVRSALPVNVRWRAARHAARVFQALRIAANEELGAIAAALPQVVDALAPGGRVAVIAFHSLEDRLVKHFFREQQAAGRLHIVTRKPLVPGEREIAANSRAASAKLRVAERTAD